MAQVLIEYVGEGDSLKAVVADAVKGNVAIAESATKAGQVASKAYKETAQSAKAAFGSQEVKKSLDNQVASIDKLKAGVQQLYKEQIKIIQQSGKQSEAFKQNIKAAADLRAQIDTLTKEQNGYSVATGKAAEKSISLTTQLKKMKAELSALDIAGKSGTKQFTDLSIAAAKLEDQIGDTRERIKVLASDTFKFDAAIGAVKGLAAGFAVVQGAVGLFAKDNEELQKAIAKTNSAMAILTGVQEISKIITGQQAEKLGFLTLAQSIYNAVVGTSVGVMRAFKIALAATGVGALVVGIGFLIEAFYTLSTSSDELSTSLDKSAKSLQKNRDEIQDLKDEIVSINDEIKVANKDMSESDAKKNKIIADGAKNTKKAIQELKDEGARLLDLNLELVRKQKEQLELADGIGGTIALQAAATTGLIITANKQRIKIIKQDIKDRIKAEQELVAKKLELVDADTKASEKGATKNAKAIKVVVKAYDELKLIIVDVTEKLAKSFATGSEAAADAELALRKKLLIQTEALQEKGLASFQDVTDKKIQVLLAEARIARANIEGQEKEKLKNVIKGSQDEIDVKNNTVRQIELIDATLQQNITAANKETQDKIKKDIDDTNKKRKEDNKKKVDEILEYAKAVGDTLNAINELQAQLSENRIAEITAQKDVQLAAINESFDTERSKIRQREAIELKAQKQIAAEKTKQAKADKALALFNAIIGTAAAVATAKTIPLKIIAGIIGATQIALIASKPIPKFAQGGVVGGKSHSEGGTQIEAEKDEFIVKRSQSVKHRKELDAINTSTQAFRAMIEQRYVRPAIMNYVLNRQQERGVTVNASLNSKSMEAELKGLRKDIRNSRTRSINSQLDSRYSWQ